MLAAACAHLLAQRGELDLHAPVSHYWPEFAAKGKADIPVSWLLCHKAGLVDIEGTLTRDQMLDWDTVTAALADSTPLWEPGTQHGYHAVTYGWLVGEVVRRVSGRSIGTFFAEEIAGPLGLDFWIGLPDEQVPRVSELIPMSPPQGLPMMAAEEGTGGGDGSAPMGLIEMLDLLLGPGNLAGRALSAPVAPHEIRTSGTTPAPGPPSCPLRAASPTQKGWHGCTPRWSARSTASGCSTSTR